MQVKKHRTALSPREMNAIDWGKQDAWIAKKYLLSPTTVWRWRRQLGKPRPKTYRFHPKAHATQNRRINWDWGLTNIQLAIKYKLSRERVRQIRLKLEARGIIEKRMDRKRGL